MEYQVTRAFKGVSAADRRIDRRSRLVEAAYGIAGREGAKELGVGRVCQSAGLTKRYFYESFGSLAELESAVVDHAIVVMTRRVEPYRPTADDRSPQAWLEAFVGALVDDVCLTRVLLTETHGGPLSPYRRQILDVAIVAMAPVGADPSTELRTRLVVYAQMGVLSELCLAWHGGHLAIDRPAFVESLADLFVRIDDIPAPRAATRSM
jgi:AcrR family transcriptional regulator